MCDSKKSNKHSIDLENTDVNLTWTSCSKYLETWWNRFHKATDFSGPITICVFCGFTALRTFWIWVPVTGSELLKGRDRLCEQAFFSPWPYELVICGVSQTQLPDSSVFSFSFGFWIGELLEFDDLNYLDGVLLTWTLSFVKEILKDY